MNYGTFYGFGNGSLPATSQYFEFTSSGKWQKPKDITFIYVELVAGGGGGGAGYSYNGFALSNFLGGGGGASGRLQRIRLRAKNIPEIVNITVGAGGAGGISATTPNGLAYGFTGGATLFHVIGSLSGGNGGDPGTPTLANGGTITAAENIFMSTASAGGNGANTNGNISSPLSTIAPLGGSGGGGYISGGTPGNGGSAILGGATTIQLNPGSITVPGGVGSTIGNGGNGLTPSAYSQDALTLSKLSNAGGGLGGGASSFATGVGGNGGAGGFPGAGGGGGGGSYNTLGGVGGKGGNGIVRIWTW